MAKPVFNKRTVSISLTEIIVVCVVALLLFGPEQLPVIARGLGKIAHEFRRTSDSLRREFYNSVYTPADELRRDVAAEELRRLPQRGLQARPDARAFSDAGVGEGLISSQRGTSSRPAW